MMVGAVQAIGMKVFCSFFPKKGVLPAACLAFSSFFGFSSGLGIASFFPKKKRLLQYSGLPAPASEGVHGAAGEEAPEGAADAEPAHARGGDEEGDDGGFAVGGVGHGAHEGAAEGAEEGEAGDGFDEDGGGGCDEDGRGAGEQAVRRIADAGDGGGPVAAGGVGVGVGTPPLDMTAPPAGSTMTKISWLTI